MVDILKLIKAANEMAPLPASSVRLAQLVQDPDAGLDDLGEVVALDQALTVRMLRMANSAFSASETRVSDVREAVMRLGAAQVLAFAISTHARAMMTKPLSRYGMEENALWKHSVRAALAIECLPKVSKRSVPSAAFAAALLHDVGKLVMDRFLAADDFEAIRRAREEGGLSPLLAEAEVLQVNHAELGGVVAQHWNLPEPIVHGIIYHHEPQRVCEEVPDLVYLANLAAKSAEGGDAIKPGELELDMGVVERTGVDGAALAELAEAVGSRFDEVFQRYEAGA
ncbi:HDOD domain-containing protein [Opitutales bacterium ASA1]|uniref:HDOD domain-containing protein n=1 Tax=Congregicoccus parvus TaxID=3081749 RepID=UPI002B2BCBDF|nr:HDOD domain-containing protein [Opitutales bacterium ASA1]